MKNKKNGIVAERCERTRLQDQLSPNQYTLYNVYHVSVALFSIVVDYGDLV